MKGIGLTVILSSLILSGCEQKVFGVREDVWASLTEEQKADVVRNYNEKERLSLRDRELKAERERARRQQLTENAERHARRVVVSVVSGSIKYKGKPTELRPSSAVVEHGSVSFVDMESVDADVSLPAMRASYIDGALTFGESRLKDEGFLVVEYSPDWKKGKHYKNMKFPFFSNYTGHVTLHISSPQKKKKKQRDILKPLKDLKDLFTL